VINGDNMAKHKGSGCEGQLCLRREGEGSAKPLKGLKRFISVFTAAGVFSMETGLDTIYGGAMGNLPREEVAIELVMGSEELDRLRGGTGLVEMPENEKHTHTEIPVCEDYNDRGVACMGLGLKGPPYRNAIAVGEFSPSEDTGNKRRFGVLSRQIREAMIDELNREGIGAKRIEDTRVYESICIIDGNTVRYKDNRPKFMIEGDYRTIDPPAGIDDNREKIEIKSYLTYGKDGWDKKVDDMRPYVRSGFISEIDEIISSIVREMLMGEEHISPTTHLHGRMVFVFVVFELTISR
jgi:hypothetical protein